MRLMKLAVPLVIFGSVLFSDHAHGLRDPKKNTPRKVCEGESMARFRVSGGAKLCETHPCFFHFHDLRERGVKAKHIKVTFNDDAFRPSCTVLTKAKVGLCRSGFTKEGSWCRFEDFVEPVSVCGFMGAWHMQLRKFDVEVKKVTFNKTAGNFSCVAHMKGMMD